LIFNANSRRSLLEKNSLSKTDFFHMSWVLESLCQNTVSEMATHQQGHKSQSYENVETPEHVDAYIFYCGDCKPFYFTVVAVLVKGTHIGTFW
jgi:hypothetical protein